MQNAEDLERRASTPSPRVRAEMLTIVCTMEGLPILTRANADPRWHRCAGDDNDELPPNT
jgi:hypothetical protein